MKKILLTLCCISTTLLSAQSTRKYSNEFLNIGIDARAFGMGNAVVANTNDVSAAYWNPAGLSQVKQNAQGTIMHAEYFASIAKYDYASVAIPLDNTQTLGVSVMRFAVDDILDTTELIDNQGNIDYDKINKFSTADYALMASYAGDAFDIDGLSIGANAKIVYRHIGKFASAIGFGLDAGLQYRTRNDFTMGIMVRDITTTFNSWTINKEEFKEINIEGLTLNQLPDESNLEITLPKINMGIAKKFFFGYNRDFSLLSELDLNFRLAKTNDIVSTDVLSMSPALGFEGGFKDIVFLRAGLNNFQNQLNIEGGKDLTYQPNFGIGFKYNGIELDYALTNIGSTSGTLYSNIFSLKLDLSLFSRR